MLLGSLTDSLVQSIEQMEGYFVPGSRAARNNNPGNLTAGPLAIGKDPQGFAIYATPEDGQADLYRQVSLDAARGKDLQTFIAGYAPPSSNDTAGYLSFLTGALGVPGSTLLSDLGAGSSPPIASSSDAAGADLTGATDWTPALVAGGVVFSWLILREVFA